MAIPCPADGRLALMLGGLLEGQEALAVESHAASCRACRATLERLNIEATAGTGTARGVPTIADTEADALVAARIRSSVDATHPPGGGPDDRTRDEAVTAGDVGDRDVAPDVPGYEVLRVLGRGGMGVVYLARQVQANRTVALKMVVAGRGGPEDLVRFRIEGESLAGLRHPNIIQVHEVGVAGGRP